MPGKYGVLRPGCPKSYHSRLPHSNARRGGLISASPKFATSAPSSPPELPAAARTTFLPRGEKGIVPGIQPVAPQGERGGARKRARVRGTAVVDCGTGRDLASSPLHDRAASLMMISSTRHRAGGSEHGRAATPLY